MSDSDDDSLPNNVFTFQNDNTTISAKGPNLNNITGLSFRNNVLTSTMHMAGNFERRGHGGSNFDQRSMYNRRETSPMSLRSVPEFGPPTFGRSMYQHGTSLQRSVYNGRCRSPMSIRSIDSTASVSAADIVFAFKNVRFNKYDLRIIKDAYNKLIKTRQRKRIEKRRNLKLFLKGTRRKSGEDTGDEGSDSSVSSDDCRSVRTTICKENIPGLRQMRDVSHYSTNIQGRKNHESDLSHFKSYTKEVPLYTDCTNNIKQNTLRNMMSVNNKVSEISTKEKFRCTMGSQDQKLSAVEVPNTSIMTQKERFKKGFLLPSQRFNKTIAGQTQVNIKETKTKNSGKNKVDLIKSVVSESDSSEEEIFRGFSVTEKEVQNLHRKRPLDTEDFCYSNKKRSKSDSPTKLCSEIPESINNNYSPNKKLNDFNFAKPKIPMKKSNTKKDLTPEKLLAKSRKPTMVEEEENVKDIDDHTQTHIHSSSDISARPSFIKRKLFTQKLDVAEQKNASCDSIGVNSPQNIYSASIREKNKARKLVTSQSCLSREVPGEDNNVIDLIHKIVPPDQINVTNVANKTGPCNNGPNHVDNSDKWDVTAIIANCDHNDVSDTYTDEEIFNVTQEKIKMSQKSVQSSMKERQCRVVIPKLSSQVINGDVKINNINEQKIKPAEKSKKSITDYVKSFWDTDFESDMELNGASSNQKNQETVLLNGNNYHGDKLSRSNKKTPISKGTILTVRNFHKDSILMNSIRSNRNTTASGKEVIELDKPISVVEGKRSTNVGENKKTNPRSQTGKKKDAVKEVQMSNTKESGRKPRVKQCVDCIKDKPINTPKKPNKSTKSSKHDVNLGDINNGYLPAKITNKSKDFKNSVSKQTNKVTTNKVIKSSQNNNVKTLKEPVSNMRIQPKRKSKEKSFIQSSELMTTINNKVASKTSKTAKQLVSNNTSLDSISTIMTRSREKQCFNSSESDYSSINLSNLSNRSLRLWQRVQRKKD